MCYSTHSCIETVDSHMLYAIGIYMGLHHSNTVIMWEFAVCNWDQKLWDDCAWHKNSSHYCYLLVLWSVLWGLNTHCWHPLASYRYYIYSTGMMLCLGALLSLIFLQDFLHTPISLARWHWTSRRPFHVIIYLYLVTYECVQAHDHRCTSALSPIIQMSWGGSVQLLMYLSLLSYWATWCH